MTMFRNRTARTATLSGAALALGLFAAPSIAAASSETQTTGQAAMQTQSAAVGQSADDTVSRFRRNRQMGFGRRGGDR